MYLRHHGFPSPLLDWTESPYIEAFFAYSGSRSSNPAVYCYIERPNGAKGGMGGDPKIKVHGPYVSTHKRHFAQKAWYTTATTWDYNTKAHSFCPHENVFKAESQKQDILVKIVLPIQEKMSALNRLAEYNINLFSLYQSEDSLIKSISMNLFNLKEIS